MVMTTNEHFCPGCKAPWYCTYSSGKCVSPYELKCHNCEDEEEIIC